MSEVNLCTTIFSEYTNIMEGYIYLHHDLIIAEGVLLQTDLLYIVIIH